ELASGGNPDELGNCFLRILAGGACQSLGQRGLQRRTAQDDAGSHHADRVRRIFGAVSEAAARLESRIGICADRTRRVLYLSRMVVGRLEMTKWRVVATR